MGVGGGGWAGKGEEGEEEWGGEGEVQNHDSCDVEKLCC